MPKLDNLESKAAFLYKEQRYAEALDIYMSLYKKSPKTEKYSIFCGNCFDAMGDNDQAARFYKHASKLNPVSETALIALANIYYAKGDFDVSEKFTNQLLKNNPENISALLNLGNIYYCRNDFETALVCYEKAYKINPSSYIAVINMANTCFDLERFVKAINHAQNALQLFPSSIDAYIILGRAYFELGRIEKAESNLLEALKLCQTNPWIYNSLSLLYQRVENWEQALLMGWNAVIYAGEAQEEQHINFGYLLYECVDEKGKEIALKYAHKWQKEFPENKIVQYMAQAIINGEPLKKADPEYIKSLFDQFAADFDQTLEALEYQVPEYMAQTVKATLKKPIGKIYRWLDLGCGTGLCGVAIKPIIGWCRLTGVDISQQMLNKAQQKNVYDQLICDEIVNHMNQTKTKYTLITAGDVLTYFGDLSEIFKAAAKVLSDHGLFIFTISENYENKDNFHLTPSGRFVHSKDYILSFVKKYGFEALQYEHKALRNEGDRVVNGWIFTFQKVLNITAEQPK